MKRFMAGFDSGSSFLCGIGRDFGKKILCKKNANDKIKKLSFQLMLVVSEQLPVAGSTE